MKKIDAQETNLKGYLGIDSETGILTIPFSQRPYEWGKAQVNRLFNDLVSLYYDEESIHMLNFFTLSAEDGLTKIFDGQQRTITSLLILAVFSEKLDEMGNEKAAEQLYSENIEKVDNLSDEPNIRKLLFEDKEMESAFYYLLDFKHSHDSKIEQLSKDLPKPFIENYSTISDSLDQFIEKNNLDVDDVRKLVRKILMNTNLITIKTDTDELAMAMFETLNNTGKKLENYYVLKNDMVRVLGERAVKDKWYQIEANLENYDQSDFLTAFATVISGKSTKVNSLERIYKFFSKQDSTQMNKLLDLLIKASKAYLYLKNPAQFTDFSSRWDYDNYRELLQNVSYFIKKQQYPLLLAMMMRDRSLNEINRLLKSLLNLGIRNLYFEENRANTIENKVADLATKVFNEGLSTNQVIKTINEISISDTELKQAIINKVVKQGQAEKNLKFILRETFNTTDLDKELEIRDNLSEIHYEHILPKKPSKNSQWLVNFPDEEERLIYTAKVGNATLLLGNFNKNISNKDFNEKKEIYIQSHIPNNRKIAEANDWTSTEIDQRTEILADQIITYLNLLIK